MSNRPKPASARQGNNSTKLTIPQNTTIVPIPDPPGTLGPWGSHLWRELWTAGRAVYAETDNHIIERYCSLSERRRTLLSLVEEEGWLAVGSTGNTIQHPAARLITEIETRLGPIEDRLGLNPESRLALGLTAIAHKSRLDEFLASELGGDET
jgi:P27 family predicted phage terminase small subunit